MDRSQFLGAILSPLLLLFKRKQPPENPIIQNYEFTGPIKPFWKCEECGLVVPGGLVSLCDHMSAYHSKTLVYKNFTKKDWDEFSRLTDQIHLD